MIGRTLEKAVYTAAEVASRQQVLDRKKLFDEIRALPRYDFTYIRCDA